MKKNPLVSVIMNCFNGEKYLRQSIESVINQKYKNWELIFWDNNSTDSSAKIIKSYKDKRIKYFFSKKNEILYRARNLAIKKTKGEILTFIDVDDFWLNNKLSKQIEFFRKNLKAEIVYSNYYIQKKNLLGFLNKKLKFKFFLPRGKITNCLLKNYCIGWLTVGIKKNIFARNKKIFNEKLNMIADYDVIMNLSLKHKIFSIQDPLAVYRYHSNQLSRRNFYLQLTHYINWFNKNKNKYKKFNNFKILSEKIKFFLKIQNLKYKKNFVSKIFDLILNKKNSFSLKLFIFCIFPNFFIKYLMSI